jgi:lipid A disaccharide synthetase
MPRSSRMSLKNNLFDKYLPPEQLYDSLTEESINDIYHNLLENSANGHKSLVILDDVQSALKNSEIVKILLNMFANRRHLKLVIFVMLQNYKAMQKGLRENVDNCIIFKMSKSQNEKIFEEVIETQKDKFDEIRSLVYKDPHDWLFVNIPSQRMFNSNWDEIIRS